MIEAYPMPEGTGAEKALRVAAASINECILCSAPPVYLGVFVAHDEPERYIPVRAKATGKGRAVWYGLCASCFTAPDKARRVEDALENSAKSARN